MPSVATVLRSSVRRSGEPTSWSDGEAARTRQVLDFVVALVELPDGVHPPMDVHAPVGARESDMVADGEGHLPSGTSQSSAI